MLINEKGKADALAETFHKSHIISNLPTKHSEAVKDSLTVLSGLPINIPRYDRVKLKNLKEDIQRLKIKKASGDLITNIRLRSLPDEAISCLATLFNACFDLSYFPDCWKLGKVVAIAKPGKDSHLPTSYRPITLLPSIGKLFEKTILHRLQIFEEDEKIFVNQQFGFRAKHSTVHQTIRITETISKRFNQNMSTALVLLDLEKAFDGVWHDALIHKMMLNKYPTHWVKMIQSFISERTSRVVVGKTSSLPFSIPAGVPQGSPLSPHLFNIFINDLPTPKNCKKAMFADDSAILSSVKNFDFPKLQKRVEKGLEVYDNFFTSWKAKVHPSKTEPILFTKSTKMRRLRNDFKIKFRGEELEWKEVVRYLGSYLDSKLTHKFHIDQVINKANKAVSILYCFLKRYNRIRAKTKAFMYKTYIRPIATYACPVFANCAITHRKKLQIFQNKKLRMCLNAPYFSKISWLHEKAETPTIDVFTTAITERFYEKCERVGNPLINNLGKYAHDLQSKRQKHKMPRALAQPN